MRLRSQANDHPLPPLPSLSQMRRYSRRIADKSMEKLEMSKIGQWVFEQQEIEERHEQPAPASKHDFRDQQAAERDRQLQQMEVAEDTLPF